MLEHHRIADGIVLTLRRRRLDKVAAADFKAQAIALIDRADQPVIIDLSDVDFIDSSGLGALVSLLKHMGPRGRLELAGLNRTVRKIFSVTRMNTVFSIRDAVPST